MKKIILPLLLFAGFAQAQIGINTTDPKTALDVNGGITNRQVAFAISANACSMNLASSETSLASITGAATATVTLTSSTTPAVNGYRLIIVNATTGGFGITFYGTTIPNGQSLEFIYANGAWKATNGGDYWKLTGNSGTNASTNFVGTTDAVDLRIRASNTERMTVKSDGKIGISTNIPISLLSNSSSAAATDASARGINTTGFNWAGSGTSYSAVISNLDNSGTGSGLLLKTNSTNTSSYPLKVMVGSNEALTVDGAANIGIGTTSPTTKLHVYSTSDPLRLEGLQASTLIADKLLTVDSNGIIKTSLESSNGFNGYITSDVTLSPAVINKVIVGTEVYDLGNEYNTTTGIFIPATTGTYEWQMETTTNFFYAVGSDYGNSDQKDRFLMGIVDNATGLFIARYAYEGAFDQRSYFAKGLVTLIAGNSYYFGVTGIASTAGPLNYGLIIANPSGATGSGLGTMFSLNRIK